MEEMQRLRAETWYEVRVVVKEECLKGYLDQQLLLEAKIPAAERGCVGFLCYHRAQGEITTFRNIQVSELAGNKLWSGLPSLDNLKETDFDEFHGAPNAK